MRPAGGTIGLVLFGAIAGCGSPPVTPPPPRATTAAPVPQQASEIEIPITAKIVDLQRALEARVPKTLWQIDEQKRACLPAQRIFKIKVTPDVSCRIVGAAVRGSISVGGSGELLTIAFPVSVRVAVKDIGKVLKGKTATAAARIRMTARLDMTPAWQPTAKVDIDYSWTRVPGIDILGQRIKFGRKVDPRLQAIIANLERALPQHLAQLNARRDAEAAWRKGFASLSLNREKPPVWMRITPERIAYDGYRVVGGDIRLFLTATALTETFVGPRPEPRVPTRLPPLVRGQPRGGAQLFVPVVASYAELEPVLAKALGKLAAKGITIRNIGQVKVRFGKVTIYATTESRIAVGVQIHAEGPTGTLKPNGTVWLTGVPFNETGSQIVRVRDLKITSATDSPATNMLAAIALSPESQAAIGASLSENFARDYAKVLEKANAALRAHREGDFVISAVLTKVTNGPLAVYGDGLYMPVAASGRAMIVFSP